MGYTRFSREDEYQYDLVTPTIWWVLIMSYITYVCFEHVWIVAVTAYPTELAYYMIWLQTKGSSKTGKQRELDFFLRMVIVTISTFMPVVVNWVFDIRGFRGLTWLFFILVLVCYVMFRLVKELIPKNDGDLLMPFFIVVITVILGDTIVSSETMTIVMTVSFVIAVWLLVVTNRFVSVFWWRVAGPILFFLLWIISMVVFFFVVDTKRGDFAKML